MLLKLILHYCVMSFSIFQPCCPSAESFCSYSSAALDIVSIKTQAGARDRRVRIHQCTFRYTAHTGTRSTAHAHRTYRHALNRTRTLHIHARPQPRTLTREFTNASTHINSHAQAHKHQNVEAVFLLSRFYQTSLKFSIVFYLLLMFCCICSLQVQVWFTNLVTLQKGITGLTNRLNCHYTQRKLAKLFSIKTQLLNGYNI